MEVEESHLAQVYHRFPICICRGRGALLYDVKGRRYLDCMGGYGVSLVGHSHPRVVEAIREQCERLIFCHSSLYNDVRAELVERLIKIAPEGLEKVFLSNSGAESVECAIKLAVKYTGRSEFISMVRGYHGKTLGALSATWNPKYRKAFKSILIPNFKFVPFGRLDRVEEVISNRTAAVIAEPIQGEGGVHIAPEGFLQGLRELCDEHGALLILDEVQTGFGRTGRMWASEHWGVSPDVMCVAKSIAGGLPMGATLARSEIMDSLRVGEHTTTFGGNPLACAAACATIDIIVEERLVERARRLGGFFMELLSNLQDLRIVRDVRGLGLMIGVECRVDIYNVLMGCIRRGMIPLYSGRNVIRLLPPLVIKEDELAEAAQILEDTLREEEQKIG
ncbi:MAG TPA: aspartate aminotransferase family protein [Candidatus Bathyarchaeota archaeon]|nr:aspartate aminotransferase family protein [Candidatus Bathyarchaeota archaeon]